MPQEYDFSHHLSPSVAAGSLSLDIPSPVPPVDPGQEYQNGDEEDANNEPEACLIISYTILAVGYLVGTIQQCPKHVLNPILGFVDDPSRVSCRLLNQNTCMYSYTNL